MIQNGDCMHLCRFAAKFCNLPENNRCSCWILLTIYLDCRYQTHWWRFFSGYCRKVAPVMFHPLTACKKSKNSFAATVGCPLNHASLHKEIFFIWMTHTVLFQRFELEYELQHSILWLTDTEYLYRTGRIHWFTSIYISIPRSLMAPSVKFGMQRNGIRIWILMYWVLCGMLGTATTMSMRFAIWKMAALSSQFAGWQNLITTVLKHSMLMLIQSKLILRYIFTHLSKNLELTIIISQPQPLTTTMSSSFQRMICSIIITILNLRAYCLCGVVSFHFKFSVCH